MESESEHKQTPIQNAQIINKLSDVVMDISLNNTNKTLSAWYYTLLIKTFSYKFAANHALKYASFIKTPLAFFATICTVLQGTEFVTSSDILFYIYFSVQIICNFLTIMNMRMTYSEQGTLFRTLSQKYEGKSLRVRDMLNLKEYNTEDIKKLTKKLEEMVTKDESTDVEFECRAKEEVNKNRRLFKLAGINITGDTDNNTRRQSAVSDSKQEKTDDAEKI